MPAWQFNLERQTRKHYLALVSRQRKDDREAVRQLPEAQQTRRRRALRAQREQEGGRELLEQAKALALHDQEINQRGTIARERKRANIAIREANWQAEKAAYRAKKAQEKADEEKRNAEYKRDYARRLTPVNDG